jgi:hypothetical protein
MSGTGTIELPWRVLRSSLQILEKPPRHLEICSLKSLRETVIDKSKAMARLIPLLPIRKEAG